MDEVDCAVIGAGAIGLAVARALAMRGREVLVLEAADRFGTGISSRSSEVIHAGIYYTPGSLKARWCTAGRDRLYAYCSQMGVGHRRCGKLIVATDAEQIDELRAIQQSAARNGVELQWLAAGQARELEPELQCQAALFSPHTGIVDSHGYMLALLGEAEQRGATVAYGSRVVRLWPEAQRLLLAVNQQTQPSLRARAVVNCAGLHAVDIAHDIATLDARHIPRMYLARGHYFGLSGRSPFRHLVYPIPVPGGLGVHLTLDIAGRARFGPDVEWVERIDYDVCLKRAASFYDSVRRFWPALGDDQLVPAYAGIRPNLSGPGAQATDFVVQGPAVHGVAGLVNLFGIDSPGLTASLPMAEHVAELVA
jgi:L-2-hydroxyglutarate oxidase LhgO